jgi:hypothetical protein
MVDKGLSVDPADAPAVPANDRMFVYDPTSERFARRMARRGSRAPQAAADLVGLEYEFEVVENTQRLDFRDLIDEVVGGGERRWFPFDPHARFLASGAVVTCDDTEAELAIAPIPRRSGVATAAADELLARRGELVAAIRQFNENTGRSLALRGYSTHLSAYCPPGRLAEIAHRFARTAAPAAMLMLDLAASPGALVRPRGNRLEIAGEYVGARDDLRAAMVFFLAAMLATAENAPLPILGGRLLPASGRTGWFVDRAAYGDDLYLDGRMARLALSGGGTILAGTLMGDVWEAARPLVEGIATREELALVDETVTGERPLPLEREPSEEEELAPLVSIKDFASILRERHRPKVAIRPVSVSWEAATFEVTTPYRSFYASVAREAFASFTRMFERGALDRTLVRYARRPFRDRILELGTTKAGLFDAMEVAEMSSADLEPRIVVTTPPEATLVPPPPRRASRRVAVAFAAAAMLGGGTAVALTALPSPKPASLAVKPIKSKPRPAVAAPKPVTKPVSRPTPKVSPSVLGAIRQVPIAPREVAPVREPRPAPRPTQPAPKPKPKPPAPPQPPPTNRDMSVSISGSASCSTGLSSLDWIVRNKDYAPGIVDIYVAYNNQKVAGISPNGVHYYQGRSSAPIPPTGNPHWVVSVRDAGGKTWSKDFFEPPGC